MAELLGAHMFLAAMRETRHGGLREQQVTRDRYTGAYYESQLGSWLVVFCERNENRGLGG